MQRSRRGYKQHRPKQGHRSSKVQYARVSRDGTRQSDTHVLSDTRIHLAEGDTYTAANMTPEQLEDWREKIRQDK